MAKVCGVTVLAARMGIGLSLQVLADDVAQTRSVDGEPLALGRAAGRPDFCCTLFEIIGELGGFRPQGQLLVFFALARSLDLTRHRGVGLPVFSCTISLTRAPYIEHRSKFVPDPGRRGEV